MPAYAATLNRSTVIVLRILPKPNLGLWNKVTPCTEWRLISNCALLWGTFIHIYWEEQTRFIYQQK